MRHRLFPWSMDVDRAGNWAPFVVALLLLAIAGLGIWSAPTQQSVVEAESGHTIPQFIEHFPQDESDVIPNDGVLRIAWHPENSELGSLKTNDRYLELGEQAIVEHTSTPANAILRASVSWFDEDNINVTVLVNTTSEIENGILRIIVIEDCVEMFGRAPSQDAVVRLYDPTPTGEGNGSISRTLQLPGELNIEDAEDLQVIVLLSDMMTEENHAMMAIELPIEGMGPVSYTHLRAHET